MTDFSILLSYAICGGISMTSGVENTEKVIALTVIQTSSLQFPLSFTITTATDVSAKSRPKMVSTSQARGSVLRSQTTTATVRSTLWWPMTLCSSFSTAIKVMADL